MDSPDPHPYLAPGCPLYVEPSPFDPFEPGIVADLSMPEYLDHPAVSRSTLWPYVSMSPYEARWEAERGKKETDAMTLGTAIHAAILEPDTLEERCWVWTRQTMKGYSERFGVDMPAKSSARSGALWDATKAAADAQNAVILTADQWAKVQDIAERARAWPRIRRLFEAGHAEKTLIWRDYETGVLVKARPDFLDPRGWAVDIKTRDDLGPLDKPAWKLNRAVRQFGYHMQAAMFVAASRACPGLGFEVRGVYLLWLRTTGAPLPRGTHLFEEALAEGHELYRKSLDLYAACLHSGEYPPPKFDPKEHLPWEIEK